jgi:tetratricopeptide (TPR) repeat protein
MSAGQRRRLSNPHGRAHQLYESGDVVQALQIYSRLIEQVDHDENDSLAKQHNMALLTYLVSAQSSNEHAFLTALKDMHSEMKKSNRLTIEMLVLIHNLALNSLVKNQPEDGIKLLLPLFEAFAENDEERLEDMKCKVCFLLIDCILALFQVKRVRDVLEWLEEFIAKKNSDDMESIMEMKFRFHCYKSRSLFIQSNYSNSNDLEKLTRSARKELKNAMEIYHNELAGKVVDRDKQSTIKTDGQDGTASVQDSVADTIGSVPNDQNRDFITLTHNTMLNGGVSNDSRSPAEIRSSDSLNRHALYLKADLEHLKGNTKKALKLCSEAEIHIDGQNEDNTNEDKNLYLQAALHNNNIAIVHQTAGHVYLAMHYYSHAIEFMEKAECIAQGIMFEDDGTTKQIPVAQIYYNAAVCAQNVQNFNSAYECMSRCIEVSPDVFVQIPSTWLLLGESCIGEFST